MILLISSVIFLLLLLAYILLLHGSKRKNLQYDEGWRQVNLKNERELDAAIAEWLLMLELPQLKEGEKRLKVARQLNLVLIEKLLLSPSFIKKEEGE